MLLFLLFYVVFQVVILSEILLGIFKVENILTLESFIIKNMDETTFGGIYLIYFFNIIVFIL